MYNKKVTSVHYKVTFERIFTGRTTANGTVTTEYKTKANRSRKIGGTEKLTRDEKNLYV